MSTIQASNLNDGTISVPTTYLTNGSAKAWVNFNGTGTIAARDSLNLSSLTDNGTGLYTINLSSNFAAADYTCNATSEGTYNGTINSIGHGDLDNTGVAAGSIRIESRGGGGIDSGSGSAFDTVITTAVMHGDLA